ncbi:MAG: GspH/FimT family pseudopilin [Pseudomonadota bacterium]
MKTLYQQAYSLIELLITLLLLALLVSFALPNFKNWVERNRIETLRDQLQAHINQARASSVIHHRDAELCGSSDGQRCDHHWELGWLLHFPETRQPINQQRLTTEDRLEWRGFSRSVRFHSNGTSPSSDGRFLFCDANGKVVLQLVINRQGRLRQVRGLEPKQNPAIRCA